MFRRRLGQLLSPMRRHSGGQVLTWIRARSNCRPSNRDCPQIGRRLSTHLGLPPAATMFSREPTQGSSGAPRMVAPEQLRCDLSTTLRIGGRRCFTAPDSPNLACVVVGYPPSNQNPPLLRLCPRVVRTTHCEQEPTRLMMISRKRLLFSASPAQNSSSGK